MHRPALVMNRIGASLIDMFLISVMYGAVVAVMTGNYSAIFNRLILVLAIIDMISQ
ncbi:RDD domain containing protein [Bacillus cereus Rock3-42]|nr:RDD domain containing protein [Bacillus cereus Rock3-42]